MLPAKDDSTAKPPAGVPAFLGRDLRGGFHSLGLGGFHLSLHGDTRLRQAEWGGLLAESRDGASGLPSRRIALRKAGYRLREVETGGTGKSVFKLWVELHRGRAA